MMRYILFFCFVGLLQAQDDKEKILYKFEGEYFSKADFEKIDSRLVFVIETKKNQTITKEVFKRRDDISLDSLKFIQIKNHLSRLTNLEYKPNQVAIFHLFEGNSKQANKIFHNKNYWNFINKNKPLIQSFIVSENNLGLKNESLDALIIDKSDFLKKLFFSNSIFKINHLVISPNGQVFLFYGGEDILYVLDASV